MSTTTTTVVPNATAPVEGVTESAPQIEAGSETTPKVEVPKKSDDFLAPKFAALSRKEKQIREMEKTIKAQQAEVQKMRTEWESKSKSSQDSEAQLLNKLKSNPLKTLSELGLTFDQLTEMQLNDQNPTPQMLIERMRAELRAEMEKEIGSVKGSLKEKEEAEAKARYEAAVTGYKQELSDFVTQNAEKYELIAANDATGLMFETAEAFYEQTGKVPNNEELAQAVEEHLEEQINEIAKLKKVQNKFAPPPAQKSEATQSKTAPTLSNTLAAEVPKSGKQLLSEEQSKKEAAKLIRWIE